MEPVAVIVGSALGGMARFWLADAIGRRLGERFPWGTLAVNASGALAIGVLAALLLGHSGSGTGTAAWHFAVFGFLGSYTTVSSFSLQTLALAHDRAWRRAAANVVLSLGLCLPATAVGLLAGRWLAGALA
ncbi:MAG: fluoride efflux transporter CrcB [Gammaproteobacteria bacterium]